MINAYEVAIKLKAEDQFSSVLDQLTKYLGDANKKATELEHKLERIGKIFKAIRDTGGREGAAHHAAHHGAPTGGTHRSAGAAVISLASMGDTAASLTRLSKTLDAFSRKSERMSSAVTTAGRLSAKLGRLAGEAGFDGVATALGKFSAEMNDVAGKIHRAARVMETLSKLGPVLERLGKTVGSDTLAKAGKAMKALGGALTRVLPVLQSFGRVFKSVIVVGLRLAGRAVAVLGRALMATPIGLIVTAIAAAAYLLYKNWKTVGPYVLRAWAAIKKAFHASAAWIVAKAKSMWSGIKKIFVSAWAGIGKFIADTVSTIYNSITGWFGKLTDWLAKSAIGRLFGMHSGAKKHAPAKPGHPAHEGKTLPPTVVCPPEKAIYVKTEVKLDGRKVAEAVTHYQTRAANRPLGGASHYDGHRGQRPVAARN